MDSLKKQLLGNLLAEQAAIDSQLKQAQKQERKLTKRLQKKQKHETEGETSASISQHQEEVCRLLRKKAQIKRRQDTVDFKIKEIKRRQECL